jgi:hypothetical protein
MTQFLKYVLLVVLATVLFAAGGAAVGACISFALYSIEWAATGGVWPESRAFLYGSMAAFAWGGIAWLVLSIMMDPRGFFALARSDRPAYQRPYLRA